MNGRQRRLMLDPEMTPIKLSDLTLGSVFHVLPEGIYQGRQPAGRRSQVSGASSSAWKKAPSRTRRRGAGAFRGSLPTPASAPTSVARSVSTSTRPITCCAPATSRPSIWPNDCKVIFGPAKRPPAPAEDRGRTTRGTSSLTKDSKSPSDLASGSAHDHRRTRTARPADALRGDDETSTAPKKKGGGAVGGVANWMDERTGGAKGMRYLMNKVFPDHWSFMLGEVAMYSLIILLITGTFLTFWYVPSMGETVYHGSYTPLQGQQMSEAYKSTVDISMDVRGGLLIRQIHHWAALLFLVAIMLHMFRVFFTGAFRKPREINWVIGVLLLHAGHDRGLRRLLTARRPAVRYRYPRRAGLHVSIPVIGSYVAYFVFGGAFPGSEIIPRLFTVHVLLLPAIIMGSVRRAHDPADRAQAHPVPRPGPHGQQRGGLQADAGVHRQGGWLLLHRLRDHGADLGSGDDQPDLDVRPVQPDDGDGRGTARLVHGLRRRCPTDHPGVVGVHTDRTHLQSQRHGRRDPAHPGDVRVLGAYPVPGGVGHRR